MNDKGLARFTDRFSQAPEPEAPQHEAESEEVSSGAFGYLRGVRDRALMLELRFKDGRVIAFSYAMLDRASFDPSEGIRLRFPGQEVLIVGQHLNKGRGVGLFDALVRHRAAWIQEASRADLLSSRGDGPLIDAIKLS